MVKVTDVTGVGACVGWHPYLNLQVGSKGDCGDLGSSATSAQNLLDSAGLS